MTIARWVGHKDGGILIGKVYGHLSNEHTQVQAARMNFGPAMVDDCRKLRRREVGNLFFRGEPSPPCVRGEGQNRVCGYAWSPAFRVLSFWNRFTPL